MCLAVPGLVKSIDGDYADVDFGGVRKRVCVSLLPAVQEGEYVIVHTGYAIERIDEDEARKRLELWEEMALQSENVD
ncbi:MAG: HypC/HybG/HupF family hydrogenase formation chaperone [Candidatus Hermodarchaeota archaeon]